MGLAVFVVHQGLAELVVDGVAAHFEPEDQTAAAHHAGKLLPPDVVLRQEFLDEAEPVGHLVANLLKLEKLLGLMLDGALEPLFRAVVEGELGAGGAGIDDEL